MTEVTEVLYETFQESKMNKLWTESTDEIVCTI